MPRFFRRLAEGVFDLEDLKLQTDALARFDIQMREIAYQSNRSFDRELGATLTRFTIDRLIASRSGLSLDSSDYASLQIHAGHFAMKPTLEVVTALVDDTARRLVRRGAIHDVNDLLPPRTWVTRAAAS